MARAKKKSRKPAKFDEQDITRRAFAAWFRSGGTDQPSNHSGYVRHKNLDYVVLYSGRNVLAVYRIRRFDGMLKRLKRWPEDLVK